MQDQYGTVVQSQIVSDCRSMSQRSSGSEVASRQWQRVPEGVALPAGLEVPQSVGQRWSDSGLAVSCSLCFFVHVCQVKFDMDRGNDLSQTRDGQISIWWGPISGCNYARLPAEKKKA